MRSAIRLGLTLSALSSAVFIAACGGSAAPKISPTSQPAVSSEDSRGAPPAAVVEPTATPDLLADLAQITPVPPESPLSPADMLLGGAPDRMSALAISDFLSAEGFDLSGTEFFVFPLPSGGGNLLAIEWTVASDYALEEDANAWMEAFLGSDALQEANIQRIALSWRVLDELGQTAAIITFTLPAEVVLAARAGEITYEQMLQQARLGWEEVQPQ